MLKINSRLYCVEDFSDVKEISNITANKEVMFIVPGMLENHISNSEYIEIANEILAYNYKIIIVLIHNQSYNFLSDLCESISGKLFNWISYLFNYNCIEYPARLLREILNSRSNTNKTYIVSHSQGGIITCNALDCPYLRYVKSNMKLFFFGSANWSLPYKFDPYNIRTYVNKNDYVAFLFGRGFCKQTIHLDSEGHSLSSYKENMKHILE